MCSSTATTPRILTPYYTRRTFRLPPLYVVYVCVCVSVYKELMTLFAIFIALVLSLPRYSSHRMNSLTPDVIIGRIAKRGKSNTEYSYRYDFHGSSRGNFSDHCMSFCIYNIPSYTLHLYILSFPCLLNSCFPSKFHDEAVDFIQF